MPTVHCGMVIYGQLPTREVYDWLMRNHYQLSLISTTHRIRHLPLVENPPAFRSDGMFGKLQMLSILQQTSYMVFSLDSRVEEAVIRRFQENLHIMYGENGEFSYMILSEYNFEAAVRSEDNTLAVSVISQLFHSILRGGVEVEAYSDTPFDEPLHKQFNYETASRQIGWLWR